MALVLRAAVSALRRPVRHRYGPSPSQVADLHLPPGPGPHPIAVVLHGGYWQPRYGRLGTRPLCLDLTRRGWAAFNVEYRRLGPRGGGGWPTTFEDVAAAIDLLAQLDDARLDRGRVVAIGHSAGGQLALWAGARPGLPGGAPGAKPRVVPARVIALAAVTDLERAGAAARALLGGHPADVPERWAQADPMRRIPLRMPVALVHPLRDATVPVAHSRAYAAAARAAGADVTLAEPPGGHRDVIDPSREAWRAAVGALSVR